MMFECGSQKASGTRGSEHRSVAPAHLSKIPNMHAHVLAMKMESQDALQSI